MAEEKELASKLPWSQEGAENFKFILFSQPPCTCTAQSAAPAPSAPAASEAPSSPAPASPKKETVLSSLDDIAKYHFPNCFVLIPKEKKGITKVERVKA